MGTPYYMSPEQASADREPSAASDVYSLGCVLYEMLVGDPPYTASSAQAVLAKILTEDARAPTAVRSSIPANVDAAIRKALEKLPADRFTGAQDFANALTDPGFRHGELAGTEAGTADGSWNRLSIATTALAALFALTTGWSLLRPGPPEPARSVERFAVPFLVGQEPVGAGLGNFDLSPDGRMLVYRWNAGNEVVLMVRRWDDFTATPIRETTGAVHAAVSLDGLEVAFQQDGQIKVAAFAGGPVRTLMPGGRPEWGPDAFVYATADSGIARIPSAGGSVEYVSRLAEGDVVHWVYDLPPGGKRALLYVPDQGGTSEVRALDLESGEMTSIVPGRHPRYLLSGHLVYSAEDGTLMTAPFDSDRMELRGTPIAVMDGVAAWSVSDAGKLFYSGGGPGGGTSGPIHQLAWVDRSGQASVVDPDWTYGRGGSAEVGFSISPDDAVVALREFSQGGYDIWLKRLDAGSHTRLTFDEGHEKMPVWEPGGGQNVTYLSDRNGNFDVWSRSADGTGEPELLLDIEADLLSAHWSPDGEWLLLWTAEDDILGYRPGEDGEPVTLLGEDYNELDPVVSPDGRWIAYVSNETGVNEVYVRPFPDVDAGRWQVSSRSARYPRWANGGGELYFQDNGASPSMWMVEVETADVFRHGAPVLLFDSPGWTGSPRFAEAFEVAWSDERFLIAVPAGAEGFDGPRFVLVNSFSEELKRLVPN